jgi:hypothetical protein
VTYLSDLFEVGGTIARLIARYRDAQVDLSSGHDETLRGQLRKAEYDAAARAEATARRLFEDHLAFIDAHSSREFGS